MKENIYELLRFRPTIASQPARPSLVKLRELQFVSITRFPAEDYLYMLFHAEMSGPLFKWVWLAHWLNSSEGLNFSEGSS